jgi:PTH1 family peptidyl-tRNA hydrolase
MKLVVGLGNPGLKYKKTRHNIGFLALDEFNKKYKKDGKSEIHVDSEKQVVLLKPLTYMNDSGIEVSRWAKYYKIESKDILVIQDDLDLAFGKIRIKQNSGSGGHNGIKSIIQNLGESDFVRLKIGIKNDYVSTTKEFVLSRFSKIEEQKLKNLILLSKSVITDFLKESPEFLMNKYNGVGDDI